MNITDVKNMRVLFVFAFSIACAIDAQEQLWLHHSDDLDPIRSLEKAVAALRLKISGNEFSTDDYMFAAEAVEAAEWVYDLNITDAEVLIPIRRMIADLLDGVLVVSASSKLALESIRRKIYGDSEPPKLLRAQLVWDLSRVQYMVKYTQDVFAELSSVTKSLMLEEQQFDAAAVLVKRIAEAAKVDSKDVSILLRQLRDLRGVIPIVKQAFIKAQKVMAIHRLKRAR